jgi:hypothetical protein
MTTTRRWPNSEIPSRSVRHQIGLFPAGWPFLGPEGKTVLLPAGTTGVKAYTDRRACPS